MWHPSNLTQDQLDVFEKEIMKRQIERELSMDSFVSDRSVIDFLAYANTFCSSLALEELKQTAEEHIKNHPYDIIFYTPIEFPMEKDWVRYEDETYREIIDWLIKKYLERYGVNYIILSWSIEERMNIINTFLFKKL